MGQEVPQRRPEADLIWDQPEGVQVIARRRVEIHQPLLRQLHDGDRGERLGDRADAKDGVRRDRFSRPDICDAVAEEPLQGAVADHAGSQTGRAPAIENLGDVELEIAAIDPRRRAVPASRVGFGA